MNTESRQTLPKWILIVSGLFALMEIGVSFLLFFSPESFADKIDLSGKGVDFLFYMWATRQLALGFILAFAAIKKSSQMLTLAYIFMLVMFVGDMIIGVIKDDNQTIFSAAFMCLVAGLLIYKINNSKIN